MALAPGQPLDDNSFGQMVHQLKQQMNNFGQHLGQLSIARPDIQGSTIAATTVGHNNSVVIDGLPYRVSLNDVTDLVQYNALVRRVTLTDFAGTERSLLCDVKLDAKVEVFEPNGDYVLQFSCGTHGDNGPQARGWVERNAQNNSIAIRVPIIGVETAARFADKFWPQEVKGLYVYDNMISHLLAIQDSFYEMHRKILHIRKQEYRQKMRRNIRVLRNRLYSLERHLETVLRNAKIAYDIFSTAMVVQEVLPAVPSPSGLPIQEPQAMAGLVEAEAMPAYQMPPMVPNQDNFDSIIAAIDIIVGQIDTRFQQIYNEFLTEFPATPRFINMNAGPGVYTAYVIDNQLIEVDMDVGQGYRDLWMVDPNDPAHDVLTYSCVYQPSIRRWLVFKPNGTYQRTAGPHCNGWGGQAMSVGSGNEDRVYFLTHTSALQFKASGILVNRIRTQRMAVIDLGQHFYRAVEAMDREMSANPALAEQQSAALSACRHKYQELVNVLNETHLMAKRREEYYDCAIYIPPQP